MFSLAVLVMTIMYMAMLFAIASWFERPASHGKKSSLLGRNLYALSLAIYCSSWTYYGAVGTASRNGWEYILIYVGPVLGITLLFPFWQRIVSSARRENVGSMADFLSSRYGKSISLGAVVTAVAIIGCVPYIALQLRSIAMASKVVNINSVIEGTEPLAVLIIAAALAGFAILFGARRPDLTEHNRGLIHAVAVESIVKLCALLVVSGFAVMLLMKSPTALPELIGNVQPLVQMPYMGPRFWAILLVSTLAIFCLPRQFHVGFVEGASRHQIKRAQWLFPLYLLLTSLAILPILIAGTNSLWGLNPDLLVLALPYTQGQRLITAIVFVGGFSAATAMVIIEAVALSAMVSTNIVLPLMTSLKVNKKPSRDASKTLLMIRRMSIISILFLGWLYYLAMDPSAGLADMGLVSFTALAQLAPALLLGVIWRKGHVNGALAGIGAGMVVWLVMLALPQIAPVLNIRMNDSFDLDDTLATAVFLSLFLNVTLYILVSRASTPRLIDRVQARAFIDHVGTEWLDNSHRPSGASVQDLRILVGRFISEERADNAFNAWARETNTTLRDSGPADAALARAAERMLAGAVGAVGARRIISAALAGGGRAPEDVVRMLDEASQAVQFNREILLNTLDNINQGVSVVDEEMRLVAWNKPYIDMFSLPPNFLNVGMAVANVYRYNAENTFTDMSSREIDKWVTNHLDYLSRRVPFKNIRHAPDGRILKAIGEPIAGGAYVTSYTDITDQRQAAIQLEEANEMLEARVTERTEQLEAARDLAERATASKTRFLAAASHDLLQPLHAARLFIAALREDPKIANSSSRSLAINADRSISSANRLLTALLNLSKLEAGGVKPAVAPLSLSILFGDIAREFTPLAEAKGLKLRVIPSTAWVSSDRDLLRSMLQNLIANAIRYTDEGSVVLGARHNGSNIDIVVADTGRGIPEGDRAAIFGEFVRLPGAPVDEPAAGLGLAIVQRLSELLAHPLSLDSRVGSGSMFRITAPRIAALAPRYEAKILERLKPLRGLNILCVDNDPSIIEALEILLSRWGAHPVTANSLKTVKAIDTPIDAALVDLHLGDHQPDGFAVIAYLKEQGVDRIALVTADTRDSLSDLVEQAGVTLLRKPVKPANLKAFLSG